MKILATGEIIFDIFNGEAEIGGAPLNFCAHCAALGAESALISAVGNDELATTALEKLDEFGVNTAYVQKNDLPTGQCLVTVRDGSPEYNVLCPAAYDKIAVTENKYDADVFAFGTLIQRDEVSRKAVKNILEKGDFKEIFCDINLRPGCYDEESCRLCLENATILKISEEEEPLLHKFSLYAAKSLERETVKSICDNFENIRLVLYTKGSNGSLIYDKTSGEYYDIPAVKTQVVSTVGAGDSYSAAFLCEYMKNKDITASGEAGAKLSAFVVAHRGAVPKD
ncbi:MAG: carbohydrate kinase [Ruminococcaceae bacterium]|nr:carbohydrate kinase [Oscillospiraceae bacterium]